MGLGAWGASVFFNCCRVGMLSGQVFLTRQAQSLSLGWLEVLVYPGRVEGQISAWRFIGL